MLLLSDLRELELDRPADALAVEVREELGLGPAGRPDGRIARLRQHQLLRPLGRVRERGVGPQSDHRVPVVVVAVEDVDVLGAGLVGLPDERAPQLGVLHHRVDEDLLAGLHIRANADGSSA
jgi:hypothetical protein